MHTSRHHFSEEPIFIKGFDKEIEAAKKFEEIGNWNSAGETYSKMVEEAAGNIAAITRTMLLTRAATCYEIAGQANPAALSYSDAARLLSQENLLPQTAGELLNRAAILYNSVGTFDFAGHYWLEAAREFCKVEAEIINSSDGRPPVPLSGFKWYVVGACYNAAGDAYAETSDLDMHACGAYWEAGNSQSYPHAIPNIQAFNAYLKALKACIKSYQTLNLDELRRILPLTQEQRAGKLNPLETMVHAAFWCNHHHQSIADEALRQSQAKLETNRLMSGVFHEFSMALNAIGNSHEAGVYRAKEQDLKRQVFWKERRYGKAVLYYIWQITSNYGESLRRWAVTCISFITLFAMLFHFGSLITPDAGWFNSLYFSWLTFTGFGYSGAYLPLGIWGQAVSSVEIAFGLFMFGVLLSFLGNRIQRT